jgi:hypothetical protein
MLVQYFGAANLRFVARRRRRHVRQLEELLSSTLGSWAVGHTLAKV